MSSKNWVMRFVETLFDCSRNVFEQSKFEQNKSEKNKSEKNKFVEKWVSAKLVQTMYKSDKSG